MKNDKKMRRQKGRRSDHSYLGIPHYILRSPEFGALKPWEVKLLIELAGLYNGKNNGDLSAAYSVLKDRGWNSPATLNGAIKGLITGGWMLRTRHGGRNRCALFALTWWPVDACEGKWLEVRAETVASHRWRKTVSVVGTCSNVVGTCSSESGEGGESWPH